MEILAEQVAIVRLGIYFSQAVLVVGVVAPISLDIDRGLGVEATKFLVMV
jgi:hypothetical protein